CLRHSDSYALTSRLPTALALLSLPDALPIYRRVLQRLRGGRQVTELQEDLLVALRRGQELHQLRGLLRVLARLRHREEGAAPVRSEEHTSELQSRENIVCRLLLEKKKTYSSD